MASKIVKLKPVPAKYEPPVQFDFFETDDRRLTNTIALWDVAPRSVFRVSDIDRAGGGLRMVKRRFTYGGANYMVSLTPARFERDGEEFEKYPGEREQLVEEVIRQIAVRRNRLSLQGDSGDVGVTFSIYEIKQELERTGHEHNFYEIVEALTILHLSQVGISRLTDDGTGKVKERVVSGSTFPMLAWGDRLREESATTVGFNWLVSQALMTLNFRQMDYDLIMRMPGPVERWLYKCINHDLFFNRSDPALHVILASDIIDGCGIRRKRLRDSIRRVSDALAWLKKAGLITDYEGRDILEGQRKADVEYRITVSDRLASQMLQAERIAAANRQEFRVITGSDPDAFVPTDIEKRKQLRTLKAKRAAEGLESILPQRAK